MKKGVKDFKQGSSFKNLLGLTLPILFSSIFSLAYNMLDVFWLGNLIGENAVASVTSSSPLILLSTTLTLGACLGLSVTLAKSLGSNDQIKERSIVTTSFVFLTIYGLILTSLSFLFSEKVISALKTPSQISNDANIYLKISIIGFFINIVYMYFSTIARGFGDSKVQLYAIVIGLILNAALDPIFISRFGIVGAATSNIIGQLVMASITIIIVYNRKIINISPKYFSLKILKEYILITIPAVIQQIIPAIASFFMLSIISSFGIIALSSYGIAGKLESFLFFPATALNMALTTCVGQCFWAKDLQKCKQYLKSGLLFGSSLVLIIVSLIIIFSTPLSSAFGASETSTVIIKSYFSIVSFGFIFNVMSHCFIGFINGTGKTLLTLVIVSISYLLVRIPFAIFLSSTYLALNGVWVSILLSQFMSVFLAFIIYNVRLNRIAKHQ